MAFVFPCNFGTLGTWMIYNQINTPTRQHVEVSVYKKNEMEILKHLYTKCTIHNE